MSTHTIGEVAERSGFSTSALRYYEGIGLVVPSSRSDGGYRLYDDADLARLAFVSRAKDLGCTLDEVSDLLGMLEQDRCAPRQRRLHDLVTDKLAAARRQVADASATAARLERAEARLRQEPVDGPCSDGCACAAPLAESRRAAPGDQVPPVACTLDVAEVPARRRAWDSLLGLSRARSRTDDGGLRVELGDAVDVEELARLVAAEQACCAFFAFTISVDGTGVSLEVRAPEHAATIVEDLFGAPT